MGDVTVKSGSRILVLALLVFFLAGCATVRLNVTVLPDGTGEQETILALDKQAYALMLSGGTDPLADVKADWEKSGIQVSRYDQDGKIGIRGFRQIKNVGFFTWENQVWSGRFDRKPSLFWTDYQFDLDTNLDGPEFHDKDAAMFISQMDWQVNVSLPVEVAEHNGQADATRHKVTWNLIPGSKDHLTLRTREYLWGRIGLVGVALVIVLGSVMFKRRTGSAVAAGHPQQPGFSEAAAQQHDGNP